jgi:hypothetical protein
LLLLAIAGVGAVFAQTPTPSTGTATDWQSVFLGKVATALGVDQARLTTAMQQAAKETRNEQIDAAVAAGRISQQYGDWLKQRPDDGRLGLRFDFGHGGFHGGKFGGRGGPGMVPPAQATPSATP